MYIFRLSFIKVELDNQITVDLKMQLRQTKDNLPIRFSYYLARLHGSQELEGKYYGELKETVLVLNKFLHIVH